MATKPVRKLAAQMRAAGRLRLRQGTVDAVNADGTVDVTLGGDDVVIGSVALLGSASTDVGVWLLQQGADLLALGSLAAVQWQPWTPALTASTTAPTLGTGAVQEGRYARLGSLIVAHFAVQFGSSGVSAGSGEYRVSLPVDADVSFIHNRRVGHGDVRDASVPSHQLVLPILRSTSTVAFVLETAGTDTVQHDVPFTFAAEDRIAGMVMYEAD